MAKSKKRAVLSAEEKLYKAVQALFILQARQLGMSNSEMRSILGVDQWEVASVAQQVNKALNKARKHKE